jgi:hypothetical protein
MWQDPIVAETRALRDEYARQFNYDIDAIFADLIARQAMHPERLVSFPPRKVSVEIINEGRRLGRGTNPNISNQ